MDLASKVGGMAMMRRIVANEWLAGNASAGPIPRGARGRAERRQFRRSAGAARTGRPFCLMRGVRSGAGRTALDAAPERIRQVDDVRRLASLLRLDQPARFLLALGFA